METENPFAPTWPQLLIASELRLKFPVILERSSARIPNWPESGVRKPDGPSLKLSKPDSPWRNFAGRCAASKGRACTRWRKQNWKSAYRKWRADRMVRAEKRIGNANPEPDFHQSFTWL